MSKVASLLWKDASNISRDGFLLMLVFYPPVLALGLRCGAPWIPVEHIELYLAPVPVMIASLHIGILLGFGLIEEREFQTFLLLRVLPLSQRMLFGYVVGTTSLLALLIGLCDAALYGLPIVQPLLFSGLIIANALTAPLIVLLLGVAAANKLEGFAISKILGVVLFVSALPFVLPLPWQLLITWVPFYWLYLGLLQAYAESAQLASLAVYWPGFSSWSFIVAPLIINLAGTLFLVRQYHRRVQ